ncbi:helix-turn-helix domain-containing protein [Nocardia transvalensis]|uniref:helix-turn-helix domain-containing protein n=1 Tax=Nocardia transvalensis TaxID=37333 RepID=UPI0018931ADC|nr:helix-turn-helix domain-containing protein [Nocardia transvalensis]MBF6333426.1 helix-turn-helix domain-containing protein [Nocardia transvalensis]
MGRLSTAIAVLKGAPAGGVNTADSDDLTIKIPYQVLSFGLSPQAISLYATLASFADDTKIHRDDIAHAAGVEHGRSAYRYLRELESAGWLTRWVVDGKFVRAQVVRKP